MCRQALAEGGRKGSLHHFSFPRKEGKTKEDKQKKAGVPGRIKAAPACAPEKRRKTQRRAAPLRSSRRISWAISLAEMVLPGAMLKSPSITLLSYVTDPPALIGCNCEKNRCVALGFTTYSPGLLQGEQLREASTDALNHNEFDRYHIRCGIKLRYEPDLLVWVCRRQE